MQDYIKIGAYIFERRAGAADNRLESCEENKELALDCGSIPIDTMSAVIYTKTVGGALVGLKNNTPIEIYRKGVLIGRYLKKSAMRTGPYSYTLEGQSPAGLLTTMAHTGGLYTGQTVNAVVKEICGDLPVIVKSSIAALRLYGWLPYQSPPNSSARDNLAQVLFATGAYLSVDNNGALRIDPLWPGMMSTNTDTAYVGGTVTYDTEVSAVELTEHAYVKLPAESKRIYSGATNDGDIITFTEPMYDLAADGFQVTASGANYAIVSGGNGTLTGVPYTHSTRTLTKAVDSGAADNVRAITDATLVSAVNSNATLVRLADYYAHRECINEDIVSATAAPGRTVNLYDPYARKAVSVCLENTRRVLSTTTKAGVVGRVGFTPPSPGAVYSTKTVLTGAGKWTVPDGVTEVTVILIGGGSGGQKGLDGAAGVRTSLILTSDSAGSGSVAAGDGGAGGVGGEGGTGGKVLRVTLTVTPGAQYTYSCGAGGVGAGTALATEGGVSIFDAYSSAAGVVSAIGFIDPISGGVYAAPGAAGQTGGAGGAGGNVSLSSKAFTSGGAGGDVLPFTGGAGSAGYYLERSPTTSSGQTRKMGWGGAGGGGAAYGANGGDGKTAVATAGEEGYGGGDGASAQKPPAPTLYGCGGTGGSGGGGGGGGAAIACSAEPGFWRTSPGGTGGAGSDGGDAAPGCVLVYYSSTHTSAMGPISTKNNKWFADKNNRLVIA